MSQIATTIEQSQRLLNAGLRSDTADMCYVQEYVTDGVGCVQYKVRWAEYPCVDLHDGDVCGVEEISFPSWSLSCLIDLRVKLGQPFNYGPMTNGSAAVIECLVDSIVDLLKYRR